MANSQEVIGTTPKVLDDGPQKYLACTIEYYESLIANHELETDVIYLVNTGIEDGVGNYTELYYGYNKLTDLIIKKGELNSEEILNIPNNKLVLNVVESEDTSGNGNGTKYYKSFALKLKYNDQLISISDFNLQSVELLNNNILKLELKGVDGSISQPIYIPILVDLPENPTGDKFLADDGIYKTVGSSYELPIASSSTLGGIKVGSGLSIDSQTGVLTATGGGGGSSYTSGNGIDITNDVISVKIKSNGGLAFDNTTKELYATGGQGTQYTAGNNIDITNDVISVAGDSTFNSSSNTVPSSSAIYNFFTTDSTFISNIASQIVIDDGVVSNS